MLTNNERISLISDAGSAPLLHEPGISWRLCRTPDELTDATDAIVLDSQDDTRLRGWLQTIRRHTVLGLLPVFIRHQQDCPEDISAMLDGVWLQDGSALEKIRTSRAQQALFSLSGTDDALQRVLHYLWLRPDSSLRPVPDWRGNRLYRYPQLECIAGNDDNAYLLLSRLQGRRLLRPDKLRDRVRTCPSCHGAHLNYVDQCPGCHHLDIEQHPSIHCFNCGHVATQKLFSHDGILQCPNCQTRLRHIGSDYDRPMENYQCRSCHLLFIEPEISARCLSCHTSHAPDALRVEPIYTYQLSETGKRLCREGELEWHIGNMLLGSLIPLEMFRFSLSWLDRLCVRYPAQGYSLLALRLSNIPDMVASNGFQQTMATLEQLGERLRAQLRSTDLTTQLAEDLILILLPNTAAADVEVLRQKISNIQQHDGDGEALQLALASYTSAANGHRTQDVSQLIDMLANEVRD